MCSKMTKITFLWFWALVTAIQCMHDMMPMNMDSDGSAYGPEKMGHGRMGRGHVESSSQERGGQGSRWGMNSFEEHGRERSSEMRHRGGHKPRHYAPRRGFESSDEERRRSHRPSGPWKYGPRRHMEFGRRNGHLRHGLRGRAAYQRHHQCPKWGKWEESSCLWPGTKPDLPKSCHFMNETKKLPEAVTKYYEAKGKEVFEVLRHVFQQRGLTKPCGFCSRKIACRSGRSHGRPHKKSIAFAFVNEECESGDACRISLVDGGCPAPFPQEKFLKYNRLIQKKNRRNNDGFYGPFEYNGHRFGFEQQQRHRRTFGWDRPQSDDPSDDQDDGDQSNSAISDEGIRPAAAPSVESSSSTGVSSEKTLPTSSDEGEQASVESSERNSKELSKSNETTEKPTSSMSKESSSSSQEQRGHGRGRDHRQRKEKGLGKRYTPYIPLWHCVKSEKLNSCLCCCGGYFPDVENGKCILVKHGNLYPPYDMFGNV